MKPIATKSPVVVAKKPSADDEPRELGDPKPPAGVLDPATLARGLAGISLSIDACATAHPMHGAVPIHVIVAPNGSVSATTSSSDPIALCLTAVIQRVSYPASATGTAFDKTYTF